ncbi:MAG TPA: NAD(P)-dependent alcohol dehydrogenase [Terriglobales bacterium]|nr:NAD(P)-dependent alcohol dehydrogenase [Terriglobales bacterium]
MSALRAVPISEEAPKAQTYTAKAVAAQNPTSGMAAITVPRRTPQPKDVQIEILYCGVCHTDVHFVRNEFAAIMPTTYPCVPGHEIVGRVVKTGNAVTKFKEGDLAAVGCMVDSDRTCEACLAGEEQYCASQPIFTYNAPDKHLGGMTYGGYSQSVVVDEDFVLRVPKNLDLAGTAPLLCAGITTYSPLRHAGVKAGQKVGVVGLGGLGHMGVKLAAAFGANVAVFTTSPSKAADAKRLGAHEVVNSKDDAEMLKHANTFDFILDTVPAKHNINPYINLLKRDGTLTFVGAPSEPLPLEVAGLLFGRKKVAGSLIGGIRETQEMLDFCGKHNVTADVEMIGVQGIDQAYERLLKNDVKYRFVIDMGSLK